MQLIHISKEVLQKTGWHIQKNAYLYDKTGNGSLKPYVVGYCPVCDAQRYLSYFGQAKETFVFECGYCKAVGGVKIW